MLKVILSPILNGLEKRRTIPIKIPNSIVLQASIFLNNEEYRNVKVRYEVPSLIDPDKFMETIKSKAPIETNIIGKIKPAKGFTAEVLIKIALVIAKGKPFTNESFFNSDFAISINLSGSIIEGTSYMLDLYGVNEICIFER